MEKQFETMLTAYQRQSTLESLRDSNLFLAENGLSLSERQMTVLADRQTGALRDAGRIALTGSILPELIRLFSDSPYLSNETLLETLLSLQELFYQFKSESSDRFSDDELLTFMKQKFDGVCGGSLDYLSDLTLGDLCRPQDDLKGAF